MSNRATAVLERISLRTRLTTISVALIGLLLLVSSSGTMSLLATYLQKNTDTLLSSTASALAHEDPAQIELRLATRQVQLPRLPSDYYIAYLDLSGNLVVGFMSATTDRNSVPNLSAFNDDFVFNTGGQPFDVENKVTTGDTGKSTATRIESWRMIAVPLTTSSGSLIVGLPNDDNDRLLGQYGLIGTGFGALLLIVSGLAIWLTISSALRPLKEVERTAAAVSGGDIGQRLLERPGKTEIARLNRSLNSMLGSIESAMNSRNKTLDQMRRFVADASHELRTPLVSVRGYAELYRMGALKKPADVAEAMSRIESEAVRMTGLVESLLTLTRLDEAATMQVSDTDLVSLAKDAAKDAQVADNKVEFAVVDLDGKAIPSGNSVRAEVDPNQMRQVLTNLLANAARFSKANGHVEIALGLEPGNGKKPRLILEVRDHGEGIPQQMRDKVFERFYRADNSRNRETGGSGLGLAIVKSIIDRHHGTISALETAGGGATFRVIVPATYPPK